MTVTYTRIDNDTVRQTTTTEPITRDLRQSETQQSIDELTDCLANMPEPRGYPPNASNEEKHIIDEWNIEHSNKFTKENTQTTIDEQTRFLDMLKAVK